MLKEVLSSFRSRFPIVALSWRAPCIKMCYVKQEDYPGQQSLPQIALCYFHFPNEKCLPCNCCSSCYILLKKCLNVVGIQGVGSEVLWLDVFTIGHVGSGSMPSYYMSHVKLVSLSPEWQFHRCPFPQIPKARSPPLLSSSHDLAFSSRRTLRQSEENFSRLPQANPFYYQHIHPDMLTLIYYYRI